MEQPRSRRRAAAWWASAAILAAGLWWWGHGGFDALVMAMPLALPAMLGSVPRERRAALWRQVAVVAVAIPGLACYGAVQRAAMMGAQVEPVAAAAFCYYVFALVIALRAGYEAGGMLLRAVLRHRVLAGAALVVATLAVLPPILLCVMQCHQMAVTGEVETRVPHRELWFHSADGTRLRGTLLQQDQPSPGVVVCHGLGAHRANLLEHAELVHRSGFQVLLFDFRAHGDSGGIATTLGDRERHDVQAAISTLLADPGTTGNKAGLVGLSMGGAASLLAAADDPRVFAVFSEAAYADLDAMVTDRGRMLPDWLAAPFVALTKVVARLTPGVDVSAVSPRRALAGLPAGLPVTIVHGDGDGVIRPAHGRALAEARPAVMFAEFAGAGHGGCLAADRTRYEGLLASTLANGLRRAESAPDWLSRPR